ncbi:hypothetical protein PR202_gb07821 [Eleusine coracana subsp. coracana]|uniref:Yippee domain-containing protein n=1 Tax=Eleusine coracana subsp. coracana TaxID=191504 RepID=A0AAV5ED34_ELECO|nr:hypothetical protein PR202_gb07821 [Eleusine coracana subsp. coracana]
MGLLFVEVLPQHAGTAVLKCRMCRVDAAYEGDILSKDFQGLYGRAYLFRHVYVPFPTPSHPPPLRAP